MVVLRRVVSSLLIMALVLGLVPVQAEANVYSERQVFDLTASGLAKIAVAESTIATAVSILKILGRVSTALSVGFVAYEVTTGFWDWWNKSYNTGTTNFPATTGSGSWGVTNGVYRYRTYSVSPAGVGYPYYPNFAGQTIIGQAWEWNSTWRDQYTYYLPAANAGLIATSSSGVASVAGGNRASALAELDGALSALTVGGQPSTQNGLSVPSSNQSGMVAGLQAARNLISNGLALDAADYVGSPGAAGNPATEAKPGAVPSSAENPPASGDVDLSGVTSAVSAASAAITSAISASQSAVVSAVNAVAAAVAASAVAIYTPIVAAVTASQAAVVSAVQAIAAPIVAAINADQAAVVGAINAIPGGETGVKAAVDSLAAADVARDQAAETAAAASQAPAVVCPVCVRDDKWSEAWGTLSAAGQAAPVFGLINRIIINPTGTIERVQTVTTSNFGVLTFNLNLWGIDTYIGVIRYVVIFVALMAGYFVIFG